MLGWFSNQSYFVRVSTFKESWTNVDSVKLVGSEVNIMVAGKFWFCLQQTAEQEYPAATIDATACTRPMISNKQ